MTKYALLPDRLVEYLKARGAQVCKIQQPVDLLICFRGITAIAAVKTGKGKLSASQTAFMGRWDGIQAVLRNEADCDELLIRMVQ